MIVETKVVKTVEVVKAVVEGGMERVVDVEATPSVEVVLPNGAMELLATTGGTEVDEAAREVVVVSTEVVEEAMTIAEVDTTLEVVITSEELKVVATEVERLVVVCE